MNHPRPLPELAAAISAQHHTICGLVQKTVATYAETGRMLAEAKEAVREQHGYGYWNQWVEENLPFNRVQAWRYIQVYERRSCLPGQQLSEYVSLKQAIALLSKDPGPEPEDKPPPPVEPDDAPDDKPDLPSDGPEPDVPDDGPGPKPDESPDVPADKPGVPVEPAGKPQPDPEPERDPAVKLLDVLYRVPNFDADHIATNCHDPERLRNAAEPVYDRLRLLVNALNRRRRANGRSVDDPQPLPAATVEAAKARGAMILK